MIKKNSSLVNTDRFINITCRKDNIIETIQKNPSAIIQKKKLNIIDEDKVDIIDGDKGKGII